MKFFLSSSELSRNIKQARMSLLQRRNLAPLQRISSRPPSPLKVDQQCLKGYDILELIGQGSAGKVYKAQRSSDRRKVALKVLEAPDEEMLQLRRSEFEVLKTVSHPNIVSAFDFFSSNSRAVLVLSYHSGQTLRKLVKHSGGLPEAVAHRLFGKLASAVDYLHSRRIIHRDITENNIIISDDRIDLHLADFNAAKALTEGGALTLTGTMDFNPPEVLNGHSSSEKHDIWSLGLCLHLMLLGSLPHKRGAESKEALSLALTRSPVRCVGPRYGGISEPCKELLRQCLAIEKEARPAAMILLQMDWLASKPVAGPGGSRPRCGSDAVAKTTSSPAMAAARVVLRSATTRERRIGRQERLHRQSVDMDVIMSP
eukprot:s1051_g8.t1